MSTALSQTAEHALRAVLFLAQRTTPVPVSAAAIAEALGAPANYLSKTLHVLARAGIVLGTRGPGGGFRLAVPCRELTVARVIGAFEDSAGSGVCLLGGRACNANKPCAAHERWTAVQEASRLPLEQTTIAELLGALARAPRGMGAEENRAVLSGAA
ncbi:MAG TPA: Rrf2 family transcriptional regulator [Longimicrobiales bacterium]|nr:Rrf2 family transcriptional regulator [Longimicrobiales bacterium]